MNISDAAYHTVHDSKGGCDSLAGRLGLAAQVLRNKVNINSSTNHLYWRESAPLMILTEDFRMLHALAAECGFVCAKVDPGTANDVGVLESVTDIWEKLGALGGKVHAALADGRVDQVEVQNIEAAIFTAIRPMMDLLKRMEGMAEK